jgi:hypothetical protein
LLGYLLLQHVDSCLEKAKQTPPEWLDADFLFRINYGPATPEDARKVKNSIIRCLRSDTTVQRRERSRLTLLDRKIAKQLHDALFKFYRSKKMFATDWPCEGIFNKDFLSPFDYDLSDPSLYPLIWTEDFVQQCVWNENYSSPILGDERPPMYAIVLDMIDLINYFESQSSSGQQTVATLLATYAKTTTSSRCFSNKDGQLNVDWASRGFLADLLNLSTCVRFLARDSSKSKRKQMHQAEIQGWNWNEEVYSRTWMENCTFPGSGLLRLRTPYLHPHIGNGDWYETLDDLDASFICSGPFKFAFTTVLAEHLTLSPHREIRLFFDCGFEEFTCPDFLGAVLKPFEKHTLGRY